ncbi:MAG: two-component system, LytT family, sensor histidine kinase AlgZ [Marinobacter excellens HL-55]|uniref:Two-component system, LytT family, sensor histidine kinase AlgZ n=1 Tax=Marinobacter excellens HL-55 TaxID=1305731 RepID=A0A0N8KKP1_9GAMM|nr:MAG: two-component system, LytT family, sensor histidine kinase AlgZ [Marinobacter excellens HL-55]
MRQYSIPVPVKETPLKPDKSINAKETADFYVPDLCRVRAVFLLLITSELLVLVLAIVQAERSWIDWNYFGLLSLFVQWTTLTSAALICLLRPWLAGLSVARATLAIIAIVLLDVLAFSLFADSVLHPEPGIGLWQGIAKKLLLALLIMLMVLRYFYLQHQWQQQREAEMQARLTSLQARIQPHFLFNSMNTIASLIATNPEQAEDAVLDLSELFRASLRTDDQLVPLSHELDLCQRYLAIEALRLGERLQLAWDIQPGLDQQAIPPLTLQPLVENAIYHGVQPRPEGGTVRVEATAKGHFVYLMVQNPKPESAGPQHQGNQIALINTQARLQALFGEPAVLKHSQQNNIYTVTLRLPKRTVSQPKTPPRH